MPGAVAVVDPLEEVALGEDPYDLPRGVRDHRRPDATVAHLADGGEDRRVGRDLHERSHGHIADRRVGDLREAAHPAPPISSDHSSPSWRGGPSCSTSAKSLSRWSITMRTSRTEMALPS